MSAREAAQAAVLDMVRRVRERLDAIEAEVKLTPAAKKRRGRKTRHAADAMKAATRLAGDVVILGMTIADLDRAENAE